MLFSIKNSDFQIKHNIIDIFMGEYLKSSSVKDGSVYALAIDFIVESISNPKLKSQVNRCLKSLCVTGHFDVITRDGVQYIALSQKGLDSYNSEEFETLEREERRKVINNRYTIAFGVITAIGVFWSLGTSIMQGLNKSTPPSAESNNRTTIQNACSSFGLHSQRFFINLNIYLCSKLQSTK